MDEETLGSVIRSAREERGWTQWDLADAIDKDQTYVSQVETGKNKRPSSDVVMRMARALGLSREKLLRLSGRVVEVVYEGVTVPVRGLVPADVVRWASGEGASVSEVRVLPEDIGDARDPYGLQVSGDCMRSIGILSGDVVIVEPAHGRTPRDGQIVVVRVGDEVALKRFRQGSNGIELEDGMGAVIYRLEESDDFEVLAFYLATKQLAPR